MALWRIRDTVVNWNQGYHNAFGRQRRQTNRRCSSDSRDVLADQSLRESLSIDITVFGSAVPRVAFIT